MKNLFLLLLLIIGLQSIGQENNLIWELNTTNTISWTVKRGQVHLDQIEMSGLNISAIINYGVDETGKLLLQKRLVFPMLRTIPNNTHASLIQNFDGTEYFTIKVDGNETKELPEVFGLNGILMIQSSTNEGIEIEHHVFPSTNKAALIELIRFKNLSGYSKKVEVDFNPVTIITPKEKGVYGEYVVQVQLIGNSNFELEPNEEVSISLVYSGRKAIEDPYSFSPVYELSKRKKFLEGISQKLILDTPNDTIDNEFAFAKIRATESIYDTKGGLMHGPGGGAYYAAIWANDQAEYVNPFFPFLGNPEGNESALNSFRHFARYMNPEYKPIPSSIIAEGTDFWNGAGDRGDQAMIAYGASRFALAYGNVDVAKELWPLIRWCLYYLDLKKAGNGIIASDSDELEGRFPAGDYNLSTNVLAYGGLVSASHLASELGKADTAEIYRNKAKELKQAIENYFGANVQGFNTYRYYDKNDKLRSWICLPLTMGIFDRKDETIKALLSPYLWTENGILTEAGSKTFWDRATLYAFRGLLASGATEKVMPYLSFYSKKRLLGDHVPYPVEAWPEGNQRHLSAESGLYCRVITEGLFGITPTGFNKFEMVPRLPKGWNKMKLTHIKAFGNDFNITVERDNNNLNIKVTSEGKEIYNNIWNEKEPVEIAF